MTHIERRWVLRPAPEATTVAALTSGRVRPELATLLAQRGIEDPGTARAFYRPDPAALHDPFLMQDMEAAVERLTEALGDAERIMVYGDYDVDGTTSVALVYGFLLKHVRSSELLSFHIPDRYKEGYGISTIGIDRAAREGVTLIIALDCGIKAVDKVEYARSKGIDMIICDHHLPGPQLPAAVAVLDPKRSDCSYPYKELSGCGIGFKLIEALAQRSGIEFAEVADQLDLVAVSTACDIVPVDGENRVLAHMGLQRLNARDLRPGFRAMLDLANIRRELQLSDLVFVLGPRINAAGRIEHGQQAVELLLSRTISEAESIGKLIDANNSTRQAFDKETTEQALAIIAEEPFYRDAWSTVVFRPDWHKGVIGIVASRLIEQHYRPTVVLTASNGKVSGSARSVKGFDLYEAISACSDLLEQYGGHTFAAGMTMPLENVDAFRTRFEQVVRERLPAHCRVPQEEIDIELPLDRIDERFIRDVERMAPFGPRNMRPVFVARGVIASSQPRLLREQHIKAELRMADGRHPPLDAIAFRLHEMVHLVSTTEPFSIVYTVEMNHWNGNSSVQVQIRDIKPGIVELNAIGTHSSTPATA